MVLEELELGGPFLLFLGNFGASAWSLAPRGTGVGDFWTADSKRFRLQELML